MKFVKTITQPLILLALTVMPFTWATAADRSSEFKNAYQEYLSVSDNAGGSAKALAKSWQAIVAQDESDPFALVLLGSSHTLMGRDALMPWSKMRHTETGLEGMALALRLLKPEHRHDDFQGMSVTHHVQTTAAITFSQVPDFFGRHEDGFYLFTDILADPAFTALPAEAKTYVYYYGIVAARQLDKTEQAEQWQQDLSALNVGDDYSDAALALE